MEESRRLADLVQERIDDAIATHREELEPLGPDAHPLLAEASHFLGGGKRFRAQFAVLGFLAVKPLDFTDTTSDDFNVIIDAAAALEFFHAAALIHDDVIDRSATRRGRPATHRVFTAHHRTQEYRGDSDHFGLSGAILLGDLLQSWADALLQRACDRTHTPASAYAARAHFNRMRSEVAVGQYLDVLEEQRTGFATHEEQLERSTRILVYKSAKYSVEAPLLIGAALAGASEQTEDALSRFGLPIGVAFQLRDDLLGVFGDERLTGKPSGDDLIEGKRTMLVALARENLASSQRRIFDELLGSPLDRQQIAMMQSTIRQSGAVARIEQLIERNVSQATSELQDAAVRPQAASQLTDLAERATVRTS